MSLGLNSAHFSLFSRYTEVDNLFKFFSLYNCIVAIAKLRTRYRTVEPRSTDTRLIRTPVFNGQFR